MAQVTIGLPVRNGARTIRTAIEAILAQTHRDLRLHISDNASDDGTADICGEYVQRDPRVRLTRHRQNIGVYPNFRHVLFAAETPFFMWAAHDDRHEPDFIAANLANLEAHPQAIVSISQVDFDDNGAFVSRAEGTTPFTGSPRENLVRYLWDPNCSSRLYGLYRTEALRKSFPDIPSFHAMDYLICGLSLLHGHHVEVPRVLFHRQIPEPGKYQLQVRGDEPTVLTRLFPAYRLSRHLLHYVPSEYRASLMPPLMRLNFFYHVAYVSHQSKVMALFWDRVRAVYRLAAGRQVRQR